MFSADIFLKLSGLFILAMTTTRSFGHLIIIGTPGSGSVSFCHFVYNVGGDCEGKTSRCNDDACEELTTYYRDFDSKQREFNKYPDIFNQKTLLLVNFGFVTLPSSIFKMSNLTGIEIKKSKIQKVNFNDFITMPRLKEIKLINNSIVTIETEEYDNSNSTVEDINVSFNLIKVVPDNFMKHFINLKNLNMSHNMIDHIDRYAFEGTFKLKTLDLSFNKLKSIENLITLIPKSIDFNVETPSKLQELSRLILDANLLVNVNFTEFFDTVTQELSIGDNDIPCSYLQAVKYSAMGEKFNRIVTAQKLCSPMEGVNGISCHKNEREYVAISFPSSNTIMLITSLKKELERISTRVEQLVEGHTINIIDINRQLREMKNELTKSEK